MKIACIVGARPQFIKHAMVSKKLGVRQEEVLIHAGQHYDYLLDKVFFKELDIPEPDYNLSVGSGSHAHQTGEILKRAEAVLLEEKPDLTLVYGDTNSTLAGALASAKLLIPVAHVEAGLRSYERYLPEEVNRVLTDHMSSVLFCPTATAVGNLRKEGVTGGVHLVGDVMYDAVEQNAGKAGRKSRILRKLGLKRKEYLLATVHRAENTDNRQNLKNIIEAFIESGENIVLPLHPRTKARLREHGLYPAASKAVNVKLTDPVGYLDMLALEQNARKILTDSGGVQKEAYALKTPCITLRKNTEWTETLKGGWNTTTGADKKQIKAAIKKQNPTQKQGRYYGNGNAAGKIALILRKSSAY